VRSPKTILLYREDDDRRLLLLIQIRLWNYRATVAKKAHDLPLFLESHPFDPVLIVPTKSNTNGTVFGEISVATNQVQMRRRARRVFDPIGVLDSSLTPGIIRICRERTIHRFYERNCGGRSLVAVGPRSKIKFYPYSLRRSPHERESTPCNAKDMK
jgi:hypothetical protein